MSTSTLALWLLLFQASVVIQVTKSSPVIKVNPGEDLVGHDVLMTSTVQVTVDEPNVGDFAAKIQGNENCNITLEKTVSQLQVYMEHVEEKISEVDNYTAKVIQGLNDHVASLEQRVEHLERKNYILEYFLEIPGSYGNSIYYICKNGTYTVQGSVDMCNRIGGYLLEINTAGEFQAIQAYLNTTTGFDFVLIAGSDADSAGTWVLPSTGESPYLDWQPGYPTVTSGWNCLLLLSSWQSPWKMKNDPCSWGSLIPSIRYICEVPEM